MHQRLLKTFFLKLNLVNEKKNKKYYCINQSKKFIIIPIIYLFLSLWGNPTLASYIRI